jgi:hypothetical protein
MSAPTGIAYQANFKTPAGTLLNIYAENGGDFAEQLDAFADFIPKIVAIESTLVPASTVARGVPLASAAAQPPSAPRAAAPEGTHLCDHGEPMKHIPAGVSKASGKPYRAFYACARPRGEQCESRISV